MNFNQRYLMWFWNSNVRSTAIVLNSMVRGNNPDVPYRALVAWLLPGSDPVLSDSYVVISAHYDHLGKKPSGEVDLIYNGANDDASGVASVIEIASALSGARPGPRRSVLFITYFGEEKGLLGSRFYANRPTVPAASIVANLNTDMFLPLFPLHSIIVQGLEESDLAGDLRKTARSLGIEVYSDPEPERNAFEHVGEKYG